MPTNQNLSVSCSTLIGIFASLLSVSSAHAQALPTFKPEGRPVAGVQVGTPTPDEGSGITFEKNRIKRTPQMLPKTALSESRWDLLYAVTEPSGPKVAYFDWDSDFIYIAWESPRPESVRFDLDGADDGFLRGADNLRVQVDTPVSLDPDAFSTNVPITAELWDATQSGDRPVKTTAPLPIGSIQAVAGRTVSGTYVVMVAIGKTELTGLTRSPGRKIGLRVESGAPLTAPDGTTILSNRPLLHLMLCDRVEAVEQNIRVALKILSSKSLVAGDGLRAVLEVTNEGTTPVSINRLFVRGSQASLPFVDSASFTGLTLGPKQSNKRELKTTVSPTTTTGTQVITGGAEWTVETGVAAPVLTTVAALASFDRVEPYAISIWQPKVPVLTSADRSIGGSQVVTVFVNSRVADTARAEVAFHLPLGWSVESNDGTSRVVVLRGKGDEVPLKFKVQVPSSTPPGQYAVEATATIEGKLYSSAATITVQAAPPSKVKPK